MHAWWEAYSLIIVCLLNKRWQWSMAVVSYEVLHAASNDRNNEYKYFIPLLWQCTDDTSIPYISTYINIVCVGGGRGWCMWFACVVQVDIDAESVGPNWCQDCSQQVCHLDGWKLWLCYMSDQTSEPYATGRLYTCAFVSLKCYIYGTSQCFNLYWLCNKCYCRVQMWRIL